MQDIFPMVNFPIVKSGKRGWQPSTMEEIVILDLSLLTPEFTTAIMLISCHIHPQSVPNSATQNMASYLTSSYIISKTDITIIPFHRSF